jgi:streptogramin lyase
VLVQRDERPATGPAQLGVAPNSLVALSARTGAVQLAVALPGRPVDMATAGSTAWVATADSAAVTAISWDAGARARSVPLRIAPSALAIGDGAVWVADGTRGIIARVAASDRRVTTRRYGPGTRARIALAAGGGGVWIADGSRTLVRVAARSGSVRRVRAPRPVTAIAYGAGALWAADTRSATIMRLDGSSGAVTDRIALLRASSGKALHPSALVFAAGGVWVLSPNASMVTRIHVHARGLAATLQLPPGGTPQDIAGGALVWVTRRDGTLASIDPATNRITSRRLGATLGTVAATDTQVWVSTRTGAQAGRPH